MLAITLLKNKTSPVNSSVTRTAMWQTKTTKGTRSNLDFNSTGECMGKNAQRCSEKSKKIPRYRVSLKK